MTELFGSTMGVVLFYICMVLVLLVTDIGYWWEYRVFGGGAWGAIGFLCWNALIISEGYVSLFKDDSDFALMLLALGMYVIFTMIKLLANCVFLNRIAKGKFHAVLMDEMPDDIKDAIKEKYAKMAHGSFEQQRKEKEEHHG